MSLRGTAFIENNTFHNNEVNAMGSGVSEPAILAIPTPDGIGGSIYVEGGSINAINNIFSENKANGATAIHVDAGVTITNDYNLFWTTDSDAPNFLSTNIVTGANSIITDPLFAELTYYHIDTLSPAKDTGTDTGLALLGVDFELDSRPQGTGVDIGADERVQRPGFEFAPTPLSSTINTGEVVTYTHWLTATGDFSEDYTLEMAHQTIGTGFGHTLSPTLISSLDPGQSVEVTLVVTGGIPGGIDVTVITATAQSSLLVRTVEDTTIISQTAGVDIEASESSIGYPDQTVSYTHTLTNTGDGIDEFELSILSETPSGWNVTLTPTQTGFLTSGASIPFTVTIQVPPGTVSDTVHTVEVIANAYGPDASDTLTDTTTIGASYGLDLEPDNAQSVNDNTIVVYTHTLTNTGNLTDTINLDYLSTPNWPVEVEPAAVTLTPLETQEVVVSVTVPADTGGVVHTALITATSEGGLTATAVNTTTVNEIRAVLLDPPNSVIVDDAGQTVTHTHTLINNGNITDTYTLSATSDLGWLVDYTAGPIQLGPNMTETVTTSISIPGAATPADIDTTRITVTSQTDASVFDWAIDETRVTPIYGLEFTPDRNSTSPAPNVISYTHYLTNTGNTEDMVTIASFSSLGWGIEMFPAPPFNIQSGASMPVVVSITVPLGASEPMVDVTTLTARSLNDSNQFATVTDTTTISGTTGTLTVTIAPDNIGFGLPTETVDYAHTVTNDGTLTATFNITAVSSNGWNINIPVDNVTLNPAESQVVTASVQIPGGTLSDTTDVMTVTAYAAANQAVFDTATDTTTVGQSTGVIIAPDNAQNTDPDTIISYTHTVTNTGNGTDTFTITAATTNNNWPIVVDPPVTIGAGLTSTVIVTLTVPVGTDGLVEPMVVTATSSSNPTLYDTAVNTTTVNGTAVVRGVVIAPNLNGSGDPGETIEYQHTITNTGDVTETFTINAIPDQSWAVFHFPSSLTLVASQSATITVRVSIPPTGVNGGDFARTSVTAFSPAGTSGGATNTTTVNLQQQNAYLPVVLNNYSAPVDPTPTPTSTPIPVQTATPTATPCTPTNIDLVVTSIEVQPANPTSGQQATVAVTIRNQGSANVAFGNNFFVDFYVNRVPGYAIYGDVSWGVQGADMTAGASRTFSAPYTFPGGAHQLYAQVDTDNTVNECPNEGNNIFGPQTLVVSGAGAGEEHEIQTVPEVTTEPRHTPTPYPPSTESESTVANEPTIVIETTPTPVYTPTGTATPTVTSTSTATQEP